MNAEGFLALARLTLKIIKQNEGMDLGSSRGSYDGGSGSSHHRLSEEGGRRATANHVRGRGGDGGGSGAGGGGGGYPWRPKLGHCGRGPGVRGRSWF